MSISSNAASARENARRGNGEFGEQEHTAPEMSLSAARSLDYIDFTPVEIDNKLAELYEQRAAILGPLGWREEDASKKRAEVEKVEAAGERYEGQLAYLTGVAEKAEDVVAAMWEAADAKTLEARPYEAEFKARGGWTRAFLTTSANGHVHSSMQCSTCNREGNVTRFAWMTDYSGADEKTIVEDAGERACTTCYPSAPVDILSRPTKMFTPDEKRKQEERVQRAEAKAAREAKKIANALTEDGSEFVVRTEPDGRPRHWRNTESFKTERAAVIWATDRFAWHGDDLRGLGHQGERQQTQLAAVREIAAAVAKKHGLPEEYVYQQIKVKGAVKAQTMTKKEGDTKLAALAAEYGVS